MKTKRFLINKQRNNESTDQANRFTNNHLNWRTIKQIFKKLHYTETNKHKNNKTSQQAT